MPLKSKDSRRGQIYDPTYCIIKSLPAQANNNPLFGLCSDLSSPKISESVHSLRFVNEVGVIMAKKLREEKQISHKLCAKELLLH